MALRKLGLTSMVLALASVSASGARAQTLEEDQEAAQAQTDAEPSGLGASDSTSPMGAEEDPPPPIGDEQAELEEEAAPQGVRSGTDPFEAAGEDYFFLGAFYRHVIIPGAFQGLFVNGGIDASNPGFGLRFGWRKDNFSVAANVWWNRAQGQGFFQGQGDPRVDTEFVDVDLGVVFVNAEFMWSFPITDWFAIELGFDLGVGFVYGDLHRTEAYETPPGEGNWQPCDGPNAPAVTGSYCEGAGGHYNYREPNWLDGGDTPLVVPWLAVPHLAVRFKPIRQIEIRLDGGYGVYNFFFGGGVSYGF